MVTQTNHQYTNYAGKINNTVICLRMVSCKHVVTQTNHQYTNYAGKINNTVICLRMGKNLTAKTPQGDFQVTIPKTPLLSQQAVTSKES